MDKIKDFWEKYEYKIVIFIGFCLIGAISFEFGILQGQKWQQKPLIIEKPAEVSLGQVAANGGISEAQGTNGAALASPSNSNTASAANTGDSSKTAAGCAFVGSKNSDKFYVPSCSYAKRVKPENLACYASEQDAISKGKIKSTCGAK